MTIPNTRPSTGAMLRLQGLANQGVKRTFGIPGGKIMLVYDALLDMAPHPERR